MCGFCRKIYAVLPASPPLINNSLNQLGGACPSEALAKEGTLTIEREKRIRLNLALTLIKITCTNRPMPQKPITQNDLQQLRQEIVNDLIEYTNKNFVTKAEFNDLKIKVNHLPTKDEFYKMMDKIMGELKIIREEQVIMSHQLSNHSDRIENLETLAHTHSN